MNNEIERGIGSFPERAHLGGIHGNLAHYFQVQSSHFNLEGTLVKVQVDSELDQCACVDRTQ